MATLKPGARAWLAADIQGNPLQRDTVGTIGQIVTLNGEQWGALIDDRGFICAFVPLRCYKRSKPRKPPRE